MSDSYYNRNEINESVSGEKKAQEIIDIFYISNSWMPDRSEACKGYDVKLTPNGSTYKVEEKFRKSKDGERKDFGIELLQRSETNPPQPGWFYTTQSNYIFYVGCTLDWTPTILYTVDWDKFKPWFLNEYLTYINKTPTTFVSPKGIGLSINISIPWGLIPEEYYKRFDINDKDK